MGFDGIVVRDSVLLQYYAASVCSLIPVFQGNVVASVLNVGRS